MHFGRAPHLQAAGQPGRELHEGPIENGDRASSECIMSPGPFSATGRSADRSARRREHGVNAVEAAGLGKEPPDLRCPSGTPSASAAWQPGEKCRSTRDSGPARGGREACCTPHLPARASLAAPASQAPAIHPFHEATGQVAYSPKTLSPAVATQGTVTRPRQLRQATSRNGGGIRVAAEMADQRRQH